MKEAETQRGRVRIEGRRPSLRDRLERRTKKMSGPLWGGGVSGRDLERYLKRLCYVVQCVYCVSKNTSVEMNICISVLWELSFPHN